MPFKAELTTICAIEASNAVIYAPIEGNDK